MFSYAGEPVSEEVSAAGAPAADCLRFREGSIIAKAMRRNPRKARAGPTTMRRVEKMSGLKPPSTLLEPPHIRMKPMIINARQPPIINRLRRGKRM